MKDQQKVDRQKESNISRRQFSGRSMAAAAGLTIFPQMAPLTMHSETRPNLLFIITDHHAFYRHDREGEFEYKPPHFEKFCSQGVHFDRAYRKGCILTVPIARGAF